MLRDYIEYLGKRKRIESDVESTKLYEERCFKTTKLGSFVAHSFIIVGFLRKIFFSVGAFGLWSDHVLPWWKHRSDSHILFLKYEDLKKVRFPVAVMYSSCQNLELQLACVS